MRRLRHQFFVPAWRGAVILALTALGAGSVLAQPANDSFANATPLDNTVPWISITDTNLGATPEGGEPNHAGFAPFSSVWYAWTAPQDGEVQLDTIGSSFDTVLAVYTGSTVSALNQIAANDDYVVTYPFPGIGQAPQTNIVGQNFTLNPPLPFLTLFPFFVTQPFTGLPGILAPGSGASSLRFNAKAGTTYYIAVDGKYGSAGTLNLSLAYHSAGVFRFATENFDVTTGIPGFPLYQTAETESSRLRYGSVGVNQFFSTIHSYYNFDAPGVLVTITRVAGSTGRVSVRYNTVEGDLISDHYTFDTVNNVLVPDGNPLPLLGDAPAIEGLDYSPVSGTLVFDDYEMSKTILIPIIDDFIVAAPNRDFAVVLSDPQRDLLESTNVSQPRLDPFYYQALVRILDCDIDPRGPSDDGAGGFVLDATNAVFNFQKANYRVPEDISDYWGARNTDITVYVNRTGTNQAAASIFYRINAPFLVNNNNEANNDFPLQPGSDYATPTPFTTGGLKGRAPSDFNGTANGTLSWPAKDFTSQPITFTINNDQVTEFNEDFQIELYDVVQGAVVPVGMVNECTVTILFDDQDPPAGSVDEFYNPDFGVEMVPPAGTEPRSFPGTDPQSQVNALVVQSDDKTIIGGDFSSYNGTARHGLTRIDQIGEVDLSFDPGDGVNIVAGEFISALGLQLDGKVVVGGTFASFNGNPCGNIIRLNTNGTIDTAFRTASGSGANGPIRSIVVRGDGRIIIGGDFTSYNGTTRKRVARLNPDGSLDTTYNPGDALNNSVYAMAPAAGTSIDVNAVASGTDLEYTNIVNVGAPSGVLTIDYDMLQVPDDLRVYYGDTNTAANTGVLIFDTGLVSGTNHVVIPFGPTNGIVANTIEIVMNQGNGQPGTFWSFTASVQTFAGDQLTVGGDFTAAGGIPGQDHIARLLGDGSLDSTFDPGAGANGRVYALVAQPDDKVVVGGDFSVVNGQSANHITRLNNNGSIDTQFFSGTGPDDIVRHLNYQTSAGGDTIYVGGPFTSYNGTHRLGFARLNIDGTLDTSFLDTAYNQFAGLPREYFGQAPNAVFTSGLQSDGKVMIGGTFSQVGGGQATWRTRPAVLNDPNLFVSEGQSNLEPKTRDGVRNRVNVARLIGGVTPGPGNVGLFNPIYPTTRSQGFVSVQLTRTNGSLGSASANFSVLPGTAHTVSDYTYNSDAPVYGTTYNFPSLVIQKARMHSDGFWGTNTVMTDVFGTNWSLGLNGMSSVLVSINPGLVIPGDVNAQFQLANPSCADNFYLGGQNIPLGVALGRSISPFNIVDDGKRPGTFGFTAPAYSGSTTTSITVGRTNGVNNTSPILMDYSTAAGPATTSGVDYFDTSGTLTFNDGETLKAFPVQVIASNYISSVEKTVNLMLRNIRGSSGALLGVSNSVLRIINPNFQGFLNFTATNYSTNLSAGAIQFTVSRTVGNKGTLEVQYSTSNNTAIAGLDYVTKTGTLHWDTGDASPRTVSVSLLNRGDVGTNRDLTVSLFNSTSNGLSAPSLLGSITNTTLTILNDNTYGIFQFNAANYVVNEASNGVATITVLRTSSSRSNATVNFATADGTALATTNYVATNGTLSFVEGQIAATFQVKILYDHAVNGTPFYFNVLLSSPSSGAQLGSPTNAQVNIVDAQSFNRPPGDGDVTFNQQGINGDVLALSLQGDGKIIAGGNFTLVGGIPRSHFARFNADGSLDNNFLNNLVGGNGSVFAAVVQSNNRILLGGAFSSINGVVRNRIVRVNTDGSLDTSFGPGSGGDDSVFALAETFIGGDRKIYAGGAFNSFEGNGVPGIVRINDNGTLDSTFLNTGVNGIVYAIAVYPTNSVFAGKIVIAGSFTTVSGIAQTNIARLNVDGSLDTSFHALANNKVRALAIQDDGAVVLGGEFSSVNGVAVNRLARLNSDGSLDATFVSNINPGANGVVNALAVQLDGRIVIGGQFTAANGVTRHRITRLLSNGSVDPTINFGDGANGEVDAIVIQPADQMIVIGGGFTQYNDHPAPHLVRIYGGSVTDSGRFEFTSASYQVNENGLQAGITVRRTGGTSGPNLDGSGSVSVNFATSPGSASPGVNYTTVATTLSFPPGEVLQTVFIPILDDLVITTNKTVNLALSGPSASTALGDQTNAVLTIVNTDNTISFASATFQVSRNTPSGVGVVTLVRTGGTSGSCTVDFATTTNGTAVIGTDYYPTNSTVTFNPGDSFKTVQIGITNNGIPEGDRTITMVLSNVVNSTLVSPSNAVLTIKDTVFAPGQLRFADTNFIVNEGDGTATITVVRTNGSSGTVSAPYYTIAGTATPGVNYVSVSNIISFSDGQTNQTFTIPLVDNNLVQGAVSLTLVLSSGTGATLAYPSNALLTIIDNDSGFVFATATNTLRETAGSTAVGVIRIGPTNSTLSVDYATHDGTAVAGVNYTTTTGTLTFTPGQVLRSIVVPVLVDPRVTGDLSFTLALSNPTPGAKLANPGTNTIIVQDADAGLSFTNSSMIVRRDAGSAVVTVICSNPSVEPVIVDSNTIPLSVQYTTVDGTAKAGIDYLTSVGTLVFTNGNGTNTFTVPIINNSTLSGSRSFNVRLLNPTVPGRLVAPSNETITIIDATAGFRFSKAAYSINKTDGAATINVFRTGLTDSVATIDFTATNGSAIAGVHYISTNGTLVFTNGVTNQTFSVQVINTSVVQPNQTVLLQLFNPTNSVVASPSAATLTIRDNTGSFVVPAGSTLVSESGAGAPNGVIDPNETVTVLFAFRDSGGLNVANLNATLVASNGVTPSPNPSTQSYGTLVAGSHSVSQPFTFTATGTNGQQILATFQLKDGVTSIGTALFDYRLGSFTTSFTNSFAIIINDNAVASPYPSTISVSNLNGQVLKATITLTNLTHASPGDIDALLVSPIQQTALFMAHAGAQNAVNGVTLNFDDAASGKLPQSGQIVSGTNQPSVYLPVPVFP